MLYPQQNLKELLQKLSTQTDSQYTIVCFCAAWCRTCNGFEAQIESLELKYPQHNFVWVDVEEHENLLIDEDIEDFPTILIQNKKGIIKRADRSALSDCRQSPGKIKASVPF